MPVLVAADKAGLFTPIRRDLPKGLTIRRLPIISRVKNQCIDLDIIDAGIQVDQMQLFTAMRIVTEVTAGILSMGVMQVAI